MGVQSMILKRIQNDNAVYWANPVPDGNGTYTYDDPVEINCFWFDKRQLVMDKNKKEVVSRSEIYTNQDLDENGFLYHGELDDIGSADYDEPKNVGGAYQILMVDKSPSIHREGEFLHKAYL